MQKKHSGISSKSGGNNGITTCEFLFRHVSVLTCGALYARHQTRVQNVDASKIPERKNALLHFSCSEFCTVVRPLKKKLKLKKKIKISHKTNQVIAPYKPDLFKRETS